MHGYEPVRVIAKPGAEFHYSGGGFLVLERMVEIATGKSAAGATREFLSSFPELTLDTSQVDGLAPGHLRFPAFAAGGYATARGMARFLQTMERAFHNLDGAGPISHDTAVQMLHGTDRGCMEFMGCRMGLGVFVAEAGKNRLMIHQGANEGYRAIYVHCYSGPDRGKGFVIFAEGDNEAVPFIAEVAQHLLRALEIRGIREFSHDFSGVSVPQEQIVNLGYKKLIFDAFEPDLPEEIVARGPLNPWSATNLAAGARVLRVSNQKFARAENLVSPHEPVFDPELFGRQGKIMDSWETARHNECGREFMELRLRQPGRVRFVELSTRFHDGNQMEWARVLGRRSANSPWKEFLPRVDLVGHGFHRVDLGSLTDEITEVRVEAGPDGGLTRLGLWNVAPPGFSVGHGRYPDPIPRAKKPLTIPFSSGTGPRVIHASNEHYGPAVQVISPYPPIHMFDGFESARSRKPGHHEEVTIALGQPSRVSRVELDFTFFVNNNPVEVAVYGRGAKGWIDLSGGRVPVKAFAGNKKVIRVRHEEPISEIRLETWPDGGVNRVRVY
ncbi:MAG: serine hydrolase [Bdellovibrionales bacterium]|nr:serine hydrolase [Bdellovibrionales bacterium]